MRNTKRFLPALAAALLALPSARAQDTELDPTVITATRYPVKLSQIPASVSLIEAKDIRNSAASNSDDLLRGQPGVSLMRSVGLGQGMPSQINIRGVPGNSRTLILADGLPLSEAATGYASINEIPLSAVERIELVRGPFSALYGSDALSGVMHVITREAGGPPRTDLSMAAGAEDFRQSSLVTSGGSKVGFLLAADGRSTDNYLARDSIKESRYSFATRSYSYAAKTAYNYDYEDLRLMLKASAALSNSAKLNLQARHFNGELGYGQKDLRPLYPVPVDLVTSTRSSLGGLSLDLGGEGESLSKLGFFFRGQERRLWGLDLAGMSGAFPLYARSRSGNQSRDWKFSWESEVPLRPGHKISYGAGFSRDKADFSPLYYDGTGTAMPGSSGRDAGVSNLDLFVQDEIMATQRLKLVTGLRLDHHSSFGTAFSPKAGALYTLSDRSLLRASVGRAFRAPSLVELYQPSMSFGYITYQSNPDLDPEYIVAADIGLEHHFSDRLEGSVGLFRNDMKDLIENKVTGAIMTNENLSKARSSGLEAGLKWSPSRLVNVFSSYTFTDGEDRGNGRKLNHIPENSASVGLRLGKEWKRWTGSLCAVESFMDERETYDWSSGQYLTMDDYWRADLSLGLEHKKGLRLECKAQNAFDATYQESLLINPAPGRIVVFQAGYTIRH